MITGMKGAALAESLTGMIMPLARVHHIHWRLSCIEQAEAYEILKKLESNLLYM